MISKLLNRKNVNPSIPVFTGVKINDETKIQLFKYNEKTCIENTKYSEKEFKGFQADDYHHWLNVHGIHDAKKITKICSQLNIHSLAIQDILDINQRPKYQEFENYWFFTMKSIVPSDNDTIEQEQLSFILGNNYLVSFQEKEADYFNHIRQRLRDNVGIVRERSSDYLLYLLLEAVLDNYFKTVSTIDKNVEELEDFNLNKDPSPLIINTIEGYKRQIHQVKKAIFPIKEFITKIEREGFCFINEKHVKYYYELKDLCLTLIDDCDQISVKLESSSNMFFSIQGHRMNQVMKTLTVVSTIFIPMTFIAGIYGMNFAHMPELSWKYGYLGVWLIMLGLSSAMIMYFKKKGW